MTARSRKQLSLIATALVVHVERQVWRELIASDHGPPSGTTRYVLHVLALFMNEVGDCYPSQWAIAKRAALTTRAVKKHIAIAKRGYWLDVTGGIHTNTSGQSWRRNSYAATVPAALHSIVQRVKDGDKRGLWTTAKGGERRSPGWGTTFPLMVNNVPINLRDLNKRSKSEGVAAVDKSSTRSKSGAAHRSKDDLKNRSAEKGRALRARIAEASKSVPTRDRRQHELSDAELATKVRALRAIGHGVGDIRRALASQASAAQLARVLKSIDARRSPAM